MTQTPLQPSTGLASLDLNTVISAMFRPSPA
jgi:hypothetical protein